MIIGLTGKAGAGKSTTAHALKHAGFRELSFAKPLKEMVYQLNPLIPLGGGQCERYQSLIDAIGLDDAKRQYPEVRRLLQTYGLAQRELEPNYWVRQQMAAIDAAPDREWCVSDVRFTNEARAILARGGIIWKIERDDYDQSAGAHTSEQGLPDELISRYVRNDETIDDLIRKVTMYARWDYWEWSESQ